MWVMAFNEDPNSRTQAVVFDVGGTAMATAVVPARVRVFEVGRDYLAGVHTSNEGGPGWPRLTPEGVNA